MGDESNATCEDGRAAVAARQSAGAADLVGRTVLQFRIVARLGEGGMGVVYKAFDDKLERDVALKVLSARYVVDDRNKELIFREARSAAAVAHPNIATIYDVYDTGDLAFIAMELIAGERLRDAIERGPLAVADAVRIAREIARGLSRAHAANIVHRDLKPDNVMLAADGHVKLLDFGLAKIAVDADGNPTSSAETRSGRVMGTPSYMSPEQARGEPTDTQTDVFSFGVVLHEMLAGAPPFAHRDSPVYEWGDDASRDWTPAPLGAKVPKRLAAIVARCLAPARAGRYASIADVLHGLDRLGARRARWPWAIAVAGVVAVAAAVVVNVKVSGERERADRNANASVLARARAELDRDPTAALRDLATLGPGADDWHDARAIAADAVSRGIARDVLHATGAISALALADDGERVAAGVADTIHMWNLRTRETRVVRLADEVLSLRFAADGSLVALTHDGTIARWDGRAPAASIVRTLGRLVHAATIAPDARRIFVGFGGISDSRIVDVATGVQTPAPYASATWSPDGASLVGIAGMHVERLAIATGTVAPVGDTGPDLATSLAADATHVWIGRQDGRLADLAAHGYHRDDLHGTVGPLLVLPSGAIACAAHGRELSDFSIAIFAAKPPWEMLRLRGHDAEITALATSRDGHLASADRGGTVRVWRLPAIARTPLDRDVAAHVATISDRGELVVGILGPRLDVRELASGRRRTLAIAPVPTPEDRSTNEIIARVGDFNVVEHVVGRSAQPFALARSRDGRTLATLSREGGRREIGALAVWNLDAASGRTLADRVTRVALSGDGKWALTCNVEHEIQKWDVAAGTPTWIGTLDATALALSADGSALAFASAQRYVAIRPARGEVIEIRTEPDTIRVLAFSPDGRVLLGGGDAPGLHVWDAATGAERVFAGHRDKITTITFAADRRRVLTASDDGTVRVWNLDAGTSIELRGHAGPVRAITFGADPDVVVTASSDRTARVWDLRDRSSIVRAGHQGDVLVAAVLGDRTFALDRSNTLTEVVDDIPRDEPALRAWLADAAHP